MLEKKKYTLIFYITIIFILTTACSSDEEKADLYNTLDKLPDNKPSSIEEIADYPVGSLTGKYYKEDMDQMIKTVKKHLPSIEEEEETDEDYLDDWWRVYHSLFAGNYPKSVGIYEEMDIEPFHHPALRETEEVYKDDINVLIVLDLSGSMKKEIDGESMISIARKAVLQFIDNLPDNANVGLRVYGHVGSGKESDKERSCSSSELIYDVQPYEQKEFKEALNRHEPKGWTPIAFSLEQAKEDFEDYPSEEYTNLVYVVSDGIETCDGDPVDTARSLSDSEIHPIINVIGFDVDKKAQKQLEEIAEVGKGLYAKAGNEEELNDAFDQQEEMLHLWEEWKKDTKKKIEDHKDEQEKNIENFYEEWNEVSNQERENIFFVINELRNTGYITENAHSYFATMRSERTEQYNILAEEMYNQLNNKVKNEYRKNQNLIQQNLETVD